MTLFQPRRGILALVLLTLSLDIAMGQKITPPSVLIGPFTVSTLPSSVANTLTTITDGTSTSDCTTGGGSSFVLCRYSGSVWSAVGGGSMVYPASGIANSTGSAWGTSYGTSGSGSVCLTVSCIMTTPALGIPSALVLTNATGLPNASVIGLGAAALQANSFFLQTANNLSDVTAATARTNLGLGTAATQSTGTSGGTLGLLSGTLTFSGANAYGTPASIILTNATGLPNASVIGLGTAALQNTGTSGANIGLLNGTLTFSGANAYGTPASIVLTNATGLPNASVIGLGTAALQNTGTSGANIGLLNGTLTFSGANAYGTPASIVLTNATGLPVGGLASVSGTGSVCLTVSCAMTTPTIVGPLVISNGVGVIDLGTTTAPTAPASGYMSLYFDSANSSHLTLMNYAGTTVDTQRTAITTGGFAVMFVGGSAVAATTLYVTIPYACTITDWIVTSDSTATVNLWRVADGGTALPTSGNTLSTSGFALSTGTRLHSTTLSDLSSTAIAAYDTFGVNLSAYGGSSGHVEFSLGCQK